MIKKTKTQKIIVILFCLGIVFRPYGTSRADDGVPAYIGGGFREYLNDKIQNGYFVEVFSRLDSRLKTRVDKRNQVEELLGYSYSTLPLINQEIEMTADQKEDTSRQFSIAVSQQRNQREQNAATTGEFHYVIYEDGQKDFFKDGLLMRSENERVSDEFGNISLKNTDNIQYNDQRLMTSYDAVITSAFGQVKKIRFEGATYTDDSVFYGSGKSNAGRNMTYYRMTETDFLGNVSQITWKADGYLGKFLQGYTEERNHDVYGYQYVHRYNIEYDSGNSDMPTSYYEDGIKNGLSYTLERSEIKYVERKEKSPLLVEYTEKYTDMYGNVSVTHAKFKFSEDVLLSSDMDILRADNLGNLSVEHSLITYTYSGGILIKAHGLAEGHNTDLYLNGKSSFIREQEYAIICGAPKLTRSYTETRSQSITGSETLRKNETLYSYGEGGLYLNGVEGSGISLNQEPQGTRSISYSQDQYEILFGEEKLIRSDHSSFAFSKHNPAGADLVEINLNQVGNDALWEKANNITTGTKIFIYDAKGLLTGASGSSVSESQDIFGNFSRTETQDNYIIRAGQALIDTQEFNTTGWDIHGNTSQGREILQYVYGEYLNTKENRGSSLALIDVHNAQVTLGNTTFAGEITLTTDVYGNTTITTVEKNNFIVLGDVILGRSVTRNESTDKEGETTYSVSTNEQELGWFDFNGEKKFGVISSTTTTTSSGQLLNGATWESTPEVITLTYQQCEL
ncbi:MAG: hypothetical protein JW788_01695, partial [Candidatus Omnitrophica bacterium]|nr:hypothetical protein [Candidatus Omnitrophota bacterium]